MARSRGSQQAADFEAPKRAEAATFERAQDWAVGRKVREGCLVESALATSGWTTLVSVTRQE